MTIEPASAATPVESPRSRSQRWQIIAMLVLAVLLGALLAGGIAYQQGGFARMAQIYFIADDVTGLSPGTTVRMSGFRVGKVAHMELQPDLKVKVVLAIEAEPFGHLRTDARATMIREQLKPVAIDLRAGTAPAPLSAADAKVAFTRRGTLTEIAEDLRTRLAPILDDVKQLTGVARERRGDIDQVLENAHAVSRELAGTAKEMHALSAELRQRVATLGSQSEATMGEANRSLARVGMLIGQADRSFDAINAKLPGLLVKTEDLVGHLDAVLRDSRTISAAAAAGLPGVMRGVPPLLEDSREMVQGLRQSWPMRSMLAPPPPTLLPIDSHDSRALRTPDAR
jgi:phospholipid/cholesterol/gamma-HCH transport system substrate-binding protein